MKKKAILIFCVVIFVLAIAAYVYFSYFNNVNLDDINRDISKATDKEILSLLAKNQDAKEYIENHADFNIQNRVILTKELITEGLNGQNFKEVYSGLEMEDNRYIKIDLMNQAGDRGLIAVIDYKEKTAPKAYGIILVKTTGQGGQLPIPAENK